MNTKIFSSILHTADINNYSDIHIKTGELPVIRNELGQIEVLKQAISENGVPIILNKIDSNGIKALITFFGAEKLLENIDSEHEIDFSFKDSYGRKYRINLYEDYKGLCFAIRSIRSEIPSLDKLGFSDEIKELLGKSQGLILFTGPTGSGKSTNIASAIEYINQNFNKHIITLEDPIEYVFENKKSIISQREIGTHSSSFDKAIRSALREDPDVIVIGEMRDPETIKSALTIAETGHLVISTLHNNDTAQAIDRIVDVFPGIQQAQIRSQFAMSLLAIISQKLLPKADLSGRVPVREILINNHAITSLILEGKNHQIYSVLEVSQNKGMILFDRYLIALFKKGLITKESLYQHARDRETVELLIGTHLLG